MSTRPPLELIRLKARAKRTEEQPRYHVLSLRVSDEEKQELQGLLTPACPSMSDLMRQALELWKVDLSVQGPTDTK